MRLQLVIAVLAAFTWFGCSDSSTSDNSNSNLTGDLTGRITLADYRGYPKVDKSGVWLKVKENYIQAITILFVPWTFQNFPSGNYPLTFPKEGCILWKDLFNSFPAEVL